MIELIVLDVDGTLTDGKIIYSNSGEETKEFNVIDGFAITAWTKKIGKKAAIITGRKSKIVENRAKELKIDYLYQNIKDKKNVLEEILKKENLTWDNVASIGDDLNDYKMIVSSKIGFTPANGHELLKKDADYVCKKEGGNGAVREMIEYILKKDNLYEEYLKLWV